MSDGKLVLAIEFKSQVGLSFGNNFNNRCEEAIGNAADVWTAYREGRFGHGFAPLLGYFFLLEDCPAVHTPVKNSGPYFKVDPAFVGASYVRRYQTLCQRLVLERLYTAACLKLATKSEPSRITHPASDLSFLRFATAIEAHAQLFRHKIAPHPHASAWRPGEAVPGTALLRHHRRAPRWAGG